MSQQQSNFADGFTELDARIDETCSCMMCLDLNHAEQQPLSLVGNPLNVAEEEHGYLHGPATNDMEHWNHSQDGSLSELEGQADAEIPESIETIAPEEKAQLAKTIKDGVDRCKQAMENSSAKLEQDIDDANRSFDAEIDSMNEWHERIKTQDLILDKRKEIHVRLPTNQVVSPAHNALVDEDAKEDILIAESFRAVKTEKADIRAKLASRIEKAEHEYTRECAALGMQIACLRNVAELSGIDLDTGIDEYTFYESTAPRQRAMVPVINIVKENCYNCGRVQEELSTARKKVERIQAAAPVPDMQNFIKHGEQILSELIQQRDSADEVATKERQDKMHTTEAALKDLAHEHARIKKIHIGIGHLWEHENQGIWQETFDLCHRELVRIKKEEQVLENLDFRCEEKVNKRQWDSKELLVKQIKFYDSLLSLARSHVVNRWGGLVPLDSDSEADSE